MQPKSTPLSLFARSRPARWLPALFLLCIAAFLFLATPVQAQSPTATVLVDKLNVRSGPGTTYAVVGSAKKNDKLTVTGQSGSCAWLKVSSGGKALGWVSGAKNFVKLSGSCSGIPVAKPSAAPSGSTGSSGSSGTAKQGCALLLNQLAFDVKLSVKRASDGWQSSWTVPNGGQAKVCVDPGAYTATFTASGMPGNMAFPVTVQGGEYYEIPLALGQ